MLVKMETFGISMLSYQRIIAVLSSYKEVEKVIIFGSRAMGNYRHGSDIDLAIAGLHCTPKLAWDIAGRLNESEPIPYAVDVVDYNSLTNPSLKEHIDCYGKVFFESSQTAPSQ